MSPGFVAKQCLVVCTAMLWAAGSAEGVADSPQQRAIVTITDADDSRSVALPVGAELVVKLQAQLGTGYGWEVSSVDASLLTLVGKPVVEKVDEAKPGQRERQAFTFRSLARGRTTLKMKYVRPWQKDAEPAKTFSVAVMVESEPHGRRER